MMGHMSQALGVVSHDGESLRRTDYLYRVSLKCLVLNAAGDVLVVKEAGRDWWDLPGGGMDHGESVAGAIARELAEEVHLQGEFTFRPIAVEEPALLQEHGFWQIRLVFKVAPRHMRFAPGSDGDAVAFMNPHQFKDAERRAERRIYEYYQLAAQ